MKRVLALIACLVPLAFATAATASPATHFTEDPTGDVFVCEDGETYTITGGTLAWRLHEDENAAGGFNFTATIVPRRGGAPRSRSGRPLVSSRSSSLGLRSRSSSRTTVSLA